MRNFQFFFVLLLIFSCSQKTTDKRIVKFENILGKKQVKSLNALVLDFENNLDVIYPSLSIKDGYKQFLVDFLSDSTENIKKFEFQSDKTNKEFHESGLWDEVYQYGYLSGLNKSVKIVDSNTQDSRKRLEANAIGKYMQALYQIQDLDDFITKYWNRREAGGLMPKELVILGILNMNADFNDYFHKRIIVLEFSF